MKTPKAKNIKKEWQKPAVRMLSIRKDTFNGSSVGAEGSTKSGPPKKF